MRKFLAFGAIAASFCAHSLHAATRVTPLTADDLQGIPGKEGAMLTVDYGPGESDPIHRHNASQTEPAHFLAFFVKDKTVPFVFPAN